MNNFRAGGIVANEALGNLSPPSLSLKNARLPRWLLPADWPDAGGSIALADITFQSGLVMNVAPTDPVQSAGRDLGGALVLPAFVDAHTHLDKAFTLRRMKSVRPGLLGAIEAMARDRGNWTSEDVRRRAGQGLQWAWESGASRVRTHVDWPDSSAPPIAWHVMAELAQQWAGKVELEQVSLMNLSYFEDADDAKRLASLVASSVPGAKLGGFVHSSNWSELALRNLLLAAQQYELDVDLHIDEELNAEALGLATLTRLMRDVGFERKVVCGHCCALAVQSESLALSTLDAVARTTITMVALPTTNLLLQDASTGRTPRQRGITLMKEARERGIPLLIASDNVQDPFCSTGSFDPLDALMAATLAAQLIDVFDDWSQCVCRPDWLADPISKQATLMGRTGDLVVFPMADLHGFPSRTGRRLLVRNGQLTDQLTSTNQADRGHELRS